MKITITNITKRLQVTLLSSSEYVARTGCNPNTHHYLDSSASTGYIWLQSWGGLQSGASSVSNTTLKAINTNGSQFAGNSWGETSFNIKFKVLNDETFQRLNECIKYKNEPLYVEVETDRKYFMWCIIDDGSNVEFGELTFLSALDGTGTYWSTGDEVFNWFPAANKGFVQSGAQSDLGDYISFEKDYMVFSLNKFITGEQFPIITIKLPIEQFALRHVNSGAMYTSTAIPEPGFQKYVYDSRTQTTYYNGVAIESAPEYFRFTGGNELLQLLIPYGFDEELLSQIEVSITYENLYSTVYGG